MHEKPGTRHGLLSSTLGLIAAYEDSFAAVFNIGCVILRISVVADFTPHIAWATKEARMRLMETAVANLRALVEGRPVNVVD